jgi:hypothetical protein
MPVRFSSSGFLLNLFSGILQLAMQSASTKSAPINSGERIAKPGNEIRRKKPEGPISFPGYLAVATVDRVADSEVVRGRT